VSLRAAAVLWSLASAAGGGSGLQAPAALGEQEQARCQVRAAVRRGVAGPRGACGGVAGRWSASGAVSWNWTVVAAGATCVRHPCATARCWWLAAPSAGASVCAAGA
jgi:hypothetical protein